MFICTYKAPGNEQPIPVFFSDSEKAKEWAKAVVHVYGKVWLWKVVQNCTSLIEEIS